MFKKTWFTVQRWILIAATIIVILLAFYLWSNRYTPNTRNAYLNAYVIPITTQVPGKVVKVFVKDNMPVKRGQPLLEIDPRPYLFALNEAKAQYGSALQKVGSLSSKVHAAIAALEKAKAQHIQSKEHFDEIHALYQDGAVSKYQLQKATRDVVVAKNAVNQAQANLYAAEKTLGSKGINNNALLAAQANVELAQWRLTHTTVHAPADGIATNLYLRPGHYANVGDPLFSFVETHHWWVVANFKETNLSLVTLGQPAAMSIDMYPGKLFTGTVTKIERGVRLSQHPPSGYLPYVPSSTDWVKLSQRIPVRIEVTDLDLKHYPFIVGSSAHVVVFTPQSHGLGWLSKAWLHVINWLGYL